MRQTILVWLSFWRDVLLRVAHADLPPVNVDRVGEIELRAARFDLPAARQRVAETERALRQMERNVNARLLTEVLLLGWT